VTQRRQETFVQMLRDMPWGEPQLVRDAYWAKRETLEIEMGIRDKNGVRLRVSDARDWPQLDRKACASEPAQLSLFEVCE
jgi:hypothetical protein